MNRLGEQFNIGPISLQRDVLDEIKSAAEELELPAESIVAEALEVWCTLHRAGWRVIEPKTRADLTCS